VPNFVAISQTVAEMAIFQFFQDGGRPPSWICYACGQATHERHFGGLYH